MRNHDRAAANREPTRRLSLGTVLTAVNVGLVAAAVLCLVAAAAGLLRRLTDEQALARVSLAASNALRAIERAGEELRVSARLLAQSPILGRLVQERDTAGLQDLFARFRRTNNLSGCAVLLEGDPLARDGGAVPWGAIARLPRGADDRFVLRPAGDGPLVLRARAAVPTAGLLPAQRRFNRSLLLIALLVGGLAALFSVLVGRRLVRPLEALTSASARIGWGDLSTPIPRVPGAEIGALASTMEEMRGHL